MAGIYNTARRKLARSWPSFGISAISLTNPAELTVDPPFESTEVPNSTTVTLKGFTEPAIAVGTFALTQTSSTKFTVPVDATGAAAFDGNVNDSRAVPIDLTDAELIANGNVIRLLDDTIKLALVSSSYTPDADADEYWSAASANVIGTPVALTGRDLVPGAASTAGTLDADDVTFSSVTAGSTVDKLVLYKDTGTATTSPLIAFWESGDVTGLPLATNNGDITIQWAAATPFIFRL